jgi:hypothetical protein
MSVQWEILTPGLAAVSFLWNLTRKASRVLDAVEKHDRKLRHHERRLRIHRRQIHQLMPKEIPAVHPDPPIELHAPLPA